MIEAQNKSFWKNRTSNLLNGMIWSCYFALIRYENSIGQGRFLNGGWTKPIDQSKLRLNPKKKDYEKQVEQKTKVNQIYSWNTEIRQ